MLYIDDGLRDQIRVAYRGPSTQAVVRDLTPGIEYQFQVRAINFNGAGPNSTASLLYSCVAPKGVQSPILQAQTETSATLRWAQPTSQGGCIITEYKVFRDDGNAGDITTEVSAFNSYTFETTVTLDASFTGKNVRFLLEATNQEGSTQSSAYLTVLIASIPPALT